MGRQEELKAKNTPIDGQHYTFVLGEGVGALTLVYAPDGWDDDEFTLQRDMHTFGVFRKFATLELKFVKDGRDYLSAAYEAGGVNTQTKFTVTEYSSMNTTRTRFIGYVDYSTYKITEVSVDIAVIDGSFTDLLLNRLNSQVNLLGTKTIDGTAIAGATTQAITLPVINIYKIGSWELSNQNPTHTTDHSIFLDVVYSEFTEDAGTVDGFFAFFDDAVNAATGAELSINIEGTINATPTSSVFSWVFHLDRYTGGVISESDVWSEVVPGDTNNFPQALSINETATFDIGIGDSCAIWVWQTVGKEIHCIDYYENSDEALAHYVRWLKTKPYLYEKHFLPHDAAAREKGTGKSFADLAREQGLKVDIVPRQSNEMFGIECLRNMLPRMFFDYQKCEKGIKAIENFRKEWNKKLGCYRERSYHDWASHGSKALIYGAESIQRLVGGSGMSAEQWNAMRKEWI